MSKIFAYTEEQLEELFYEFIDDLFKEKSIESEKYSADELSKEFVKFCFMNSD